MNVRNLIRLATALAVAIATPAHATNGMRMIGFGPVQNSMGGVGVGATLDAASILTNPAGMSELGGRVDFGATYFLPTVKYSATGIDPTNMLVNQPGVTLQSDKGASPIPAFGLIVPIDDRWALGIGAMVGVKVKPIEMLLVAADVEWINWPPRAERTSPPSRSTRAAPCPGT